MHIIAQDARIAGDDGKATAAAASAPKIGQPVPDSSPPHKAAHSGSASAIAARRKQRISALGRTLRWVLLDIPLLTAFCMLLSAHLLQHVYQGTIQPLVESYRRGEADDEGYYSEFDFDLTYYNRQCDAEDISTHDASDLIITKEQTGAEAANVMMEHGAVVFKNVLSEQTATDLRAYLESRNEVRDTLSWHEKFWYEIGRLALGLGAHDNPVITKALHEVGTHAEIKKTIEGILGPDPAIVEISTMTSMHGAGDQGIHTDSDYFGSSVLYARNFLHSYTMFMALQDTTSKMGATTVCPGSHHCANIDLEDVCMEDDNAFEVSTNGLTGKEHGVWQKGDAMMFNQNVWHRGAANRDKENPINRVMFIVTFISRNKQTPGDRRQQGLGTYYYQRWNHWGHTYSDLMNVDWLMTQPMITLRSWGIWKLSGAKWGITWLEHFARQLANDEDFYASYELEPFIDYLNSIGIPDFLQGTPPDDWEPFLESMTQNWINFLTKVNTIAHAAYVGLYIVLSGLIWLCSRSKSTSATGGTKTPWIPAIVKRLLFTHGTAVFLFYLFSIQMDNTILAKKVKSGEAFIRPYSPPLEWQKDGFDQTTALAMTKDLELGPTAFPERMDILVGTRFDAEWLGIYNHMLDFHPGNKRYQSIVEEVAAYPLSDVSAGKWLLQKAQDPLKNVAARFLFQNPANGLWSVMDDSEALKIAIKSIKAHRDSITKQLWIQLKEIQADGRFGPLRDTDMARRFTHRFVKHWDAIIFGQDVMATTSNGGKSKNISKKSKFNNEQQQQQQKDISSLVRKNRIIKLPSPTKKDQETIILQLGDRVRAHYRMSGAWLEGEIAGIYDSHSCMVAFKNGEYSNLSHNSVQPYVPYIEGDHVEVLHESDRWFPAKIRNIHPLGMHNIDYDDGEDDVASPDYIRPLSFRAVSFDTEMLNEIDQDEEKDEDGHFSNVEDDDDEEDDDEEDEDEDEDEDDDDDDDDDDEDDVHNSPNNNHMNDDNDKYEVGERVKANFKNTGKWFDGVIAAVATDGTYSVRYNDGDFEADVPDERLDDLE